MNNYEMQNYIISIENSADAVCSELGMEPFNHLLHTFDAVDIYSLHDADLSDFYSELHALEADLA